jgi:carbamoyl-phosphate synthase small subunit
MARTPSKPRTTAPAPKDKPAGATGVLVLSDGTVLWGHGLGATGSAVGEVCFNTAMTGYEETLTDPSYAGQIITFTFPHIGNVGANATDIEARKPAARGLILRAAITAPSNWRAEQPLETWLKKNHLVGLAGIDTRALTARIRDRGAPNGVIAHAPDGKFDLDKLRKQAAAWPGLEGMDLAKEVTCEKAYEWKEGVWSLEGEAENSAHSLQPLASFHVVAVDYGAKLNILRCLVDAGCRVTVVPATATADDILRHKPDGVFLSNGPGDPAATGEYAVPAIKAVLERGIPLFGICLGHQLLALALGGKTRKMKLGHRGANQPVKDLLTGKVEITSQNHGFEVLEDSLPASAEVTHVSLFDGTNEGLRLKDKPAFSVQYHPEASPGPHDSHYLFKRFTDMIAKHKSSRRAA